jgi:hypothetical protein
MFGVGISNLKCMLSADVVFRQLAYVLIIFSFITNGNA